MDRNSQRPAVNVAFYARVAADRNDGSIDTQLERLASWVDDRRAEGENWVAREKLVDRGRSAYNTRRPAYRELMTLVRSRRIDAVAVTRLDRISRNVGDLAKFLRELGRRGVRLVSIAEGIDAASPIGLPVKIDSFRPTAEKRRSR